MRAIFAGYEFANIGDFLVRYRKHKDSNTTKYNKEAVREHFEMCREMFS